MVSKFQRMLPCSAPGGHGGRLAPGVDRAPCPAGGVADPVESWLSGVGTLALATVQHHHVSPDDQHSAS